MTWKLFCVISVFLLGILAASIVNSANAAEHVRVQRDIQDRIQVDFFKNNHTSQTLFPPFLVKDISPGPKGTIPAGQASTSGRLFFVANESLWATDGTTSGTIPLINMLAMHLTATDKFLFFTNYIGTQLWVSDGTVNGTRMIRDFGAYYGIGCSPECFGDFIAVGNMLYFTAIDGIHGTELWNSDGYDVWMSDVNEGSSGSNPSFMGVMSGTLFFSANDGTHGPELWKRDGHSTVMVRDIVTGSNGSTPSGFSCVNGTLFFSADDGTHGRELWKSDGTGNGTVLVKDINTGSASSNPSILVNVNDMLFFRADDGIHGRELWKSHGTETGTVLVKDVAPQTTCDEWGHDPGSGSNPCSSEIYRMATANNLLFFTAIDWVNIDEYLWISDGTEPGTKELHIFSTGGPSNLSWDYLLPYHGLLFFGVGNDSGSVEVWRTNGNAENTEMVFRAEGNVLPCLSSVQRNLIFFWGQDSQHGIELWGYHPLVFSSYLPLIAKRQQ